MNGAVRFVGYQQASPMTILHHLPSDISRHRVLATKDAAAFCGLSVTTFLRLRGKRSIPAPIRLSERRLGWRIGDLMDWQDARAAGRDWQVRAAAQ